AYLELLRDFPERLKRARRERPLIIFLDALDQLSDSALHWLPQTLPQHVHLVLSTLPEPHPWLPMLRSRYPGRSFLELPGLPPRDGEKLLELWLRDARRTLQPTQREALMAAFSDCPLPLWLKLAFPQARRC